MWKTNSFRKQILLIALLLNSFLLYSQISIKGIIKDEANGIPLPGVNVVIKGTTTGTTTDQNGEYKITVANGTQVLRFSFIGYSAKEITVGDQTVISVDLKSDLANLDEVVVVGYGTSRRRDIVGAVTSVKGDDVLESDPTSIQGALSGRAAGVVVTQGTGGPGGGYSVLIRGGSSITSGNEPLYVIDGVQILSQSSDASRNPLSDMNPSEVESIEILKDASATAIYGAKGANGVIIITTKRGSEQTKISVNYNGTYSIMTNVPEVLSPDEYLDFAINKYTNKVLDDGEPMRWQDQRRYWLNVKETGQPGTAWIDEIVKPALSNNINLSASGGDKDSKYAFNAGYLNEVGIIKNTNFDRFNFSTNLSQSFNKRFTIGSNIKFNISRQNGFFDVRDGNTANYFSGGEANIIKKTLQSNPYLPKDFDLDQLNEMDPTNSWNSDNIIKYIDEVDIENDAKRVITNIYLDLKLTDDLNFYTSYALNYHFSKGHEFYPSTVARGKPTNGNLRERSNENLSWIYEARLNYTKEFNKHRIDATGVFEALDNSGEYRYMYLDQFSDELLGADSYSPVLGLYTPTKVLFEETMLSYLGRAGYSYTNKYYLSGSLRADGSSKFGKNNKWGYFPSMAAAWVISEENFMSGISVIDILKLRGSWGYTGNNQIPAYQSLPIITFGSNYASNGTQLGGSYISKPENPDLKWEKTEQINIGFDLNMFSNRIQLVGEYYYKETTDLLFVKNLPNFSGFRTALLNVGSIYNKGLEFTLTTYNIQKPDFTWQTTFTYTQNRSKVLDLGGDNEQIYTSGMNYAVHDDLILRVGESIGTFYGYLQDGVYNNSTEAANSPITPDNKPGFGKLIDINQDGVINANDRVIIGNTTPDFSGGIHNEFKYKNFDLSIFLRYSYGGDIINGNIAYLDRGGMHNWNSLGTIAPNIWYPSAPLYNGTGEIPEGTWGTMMRSDYVEDGSYLNCDYINLGYTFNNNFTERLKLNSLRLYCGVKNPFIITRYSWYSPDINTTNAPQGAPSNRIGSGIDVGTYPRTTSFNLGLSINF